MRLVVVAVLVASLALAACGSSSSHSSSSTAGAASAPSVSGTSSTSTSSSTLSTSVRFLAHAGLAFGAFHRYIYKPLRAGEFTHPLLHKVAVLKATAAAVFVVHEIAQAAAAAKQDPLLAKLAEPLATLGAGFSSALAKVKTGRFNPAEILSANFAIASIEGAAVGAGAPISEHVPSIP